MLDDRRLIRGAIVIGPLSGRRMQMFKRLLHVSLSVFGVALGVAIGCLFSTVFGEFGAQQDALVAAGLCTLVLGGLGVGMLKVKKDEACILIACGVLIPLVTWLAI